MPSGRMCSSTVHFSVRAEMGQPRQPASRFLRAMQRHASVPDVVTYRAAISVCEKGQHYKQALHLLRAMQRHAIVPDVVIYGAAICVRESSSSTNGLYISHVRCGAMPSFRTWSPTVLPSAGAISASSASRPYIFYERCNTMPSCRR